MQKLLFSFTALVCAAFFACTKPDQEAPQPPATNPLSIGDGYGKSNKPFSGARWQLPAGVTLADSNRIHDVTYCFYQRNPPVFEDVYRFRGTPGGAFTVCFTLRNTTNQPITILPPSTFIVESEAVSTQNGLIINLGSILIPASSEVTIFANAFCLNSNRDIPGSDPEHLTFQFGPTQLPAALQEVADLIAAKNITGDAIVNPATGDVDGDKYLQLSVLQMAIWEVTEEGKLSENLKKQIEDLTL